MHQTQFATWIMALAMGVIAGGCAVNPVTGRRELALVSQDQEIATGREADPQIRSEFGTVQNQTLQNYTARMGERLAKVSHRPEIEWHFTVLDSPVLNAFALPGGYVYLTREILAYVNSEAELAAVMGHEIGHVTARHSVDQMTKAQLANLGLTLGGILSPTVRELGSVAQAGLSLLFLKYSRDDERQADQLGVEYAAKAGFDPRQASGFFEVLKLTAGKDGGAAVPSWLATHPDPPERAQATREAAEQWIQKLGSGTWREGREDYLAQLDGLVFGENPREGFSEGGVFFHPEMRFQIEFPRGWKIQNTRRAVVAVEPNQKAQIELAVLPVPAGTSGEAYARELAAKGRIPIDGRRIELNGNQGYIATYRVQDQSGGSLDAFAAFVDYRGSLFQILEVVAPSFGESRSSFQSTLGTFRPLNDPRILNVQPDRIVIENLQERLTLRQLVARVSSSSADGETVALLNRMSLDQLLPPGTKVKLIRKGRPRQGS